MNRTLMMTSLAAALIAASFLASAQTPATDSTKPAADGTQTQKSYTDPNDPSKGQDLVSDAKSTETNPATVGQDKATGNNLVAPKEDPTAGASKHPEFATLDARKVGYLTAADVSTHTWLSANFARCNTGNDGHLTAQEYAVCIE